MEEQNKELETKNSKLQVDLAKAQSVRLVAEVAFQQVWELEIENSKLCLLVKGNFCMHTSPGNQNHNTVANPPEPNQMPETPRNSYPQCPTCCGPGKTRNAKLSQRPSLHSISWRYRPIRQSLINAVQAWAFLASAGDRHKCNE